MCFSSFNSTYLKLGYQKLLKKGSKSGFRMVQFEKGSEGGQFGQKVGRVGQKCPAGFVVNDSSVFKCIWERVKLVV